MCSPAIVKAFEARNLIPVVTGGRHSGKHPETYNDGSYPIDECFASSSLTIKKRGFLRHGDNGSDHRAVWLDIEKQSALGVLPPDIQGYQARKLKTSDPRIVSKYNFILEEEFCCHNVYNRALAIYNKCFTHPSPEVFAEYDKLDKVRDRCMKKAERKCRKLHMGSVPWSPEMQRARTTILYIKLCIRRRKGRKVSARTLIRLQSKLQISYEHVEEKQLIKYLDQAFKYYKKMKKKASDLRKTHLEHLAEALEKKGKGKKPKYSKICNTKRNNGQCIGSYIISNPNILITCRHHLLLLHMLMAQQQKFWKRIKWFKLLLLRMKKSIISVRIPALFYYLLCDSNLVPMVKLQQLNRY